MKVQLVKYFQWIISSISLIRVKLQTVRLTCVPYGANSFWNKRFWSLNSVPHLVARLDGSCMVCEWSQGLGKRTQMHRIQRCRDGSVTSISQLSHSSDITVEPDLLFFSLQVDSAICRIRSGREQSHKFVVFPKSRCMKISRLCLGIRPRPLRFVGAARTLQYPDRHN